MTVGAFPGPPGALFWELPTSLPTQHLWLEHTGSAPTRPGTSVNVPVVHTLFLEEVRAGWPLPVAHVQLAGKSEALGACWLQPMAHAQLATKEQGLQVACSPESPADQLLVERVHRIKIKTGREWNHNEGAKSQNLF